MSKTKRIPAERDLPSNAAELLATAKREACDVADIQPEEFERHAAARQFAAAMLAHVPTGDHPFCVRSVLGCTRANAIVGRTAKDATTNDLRSHHPGWADRALRKASKLLAVWAADAKRETSTRDLTWTARTFGVTEFGALGIEWYREETCDTGEEIRIVNRAQSVQCRELSTELQRELRYLIAFSSEVNQRVEMILRRHLEAK